MTLKDHIVELFKFPRTIDNLTGALHCIYKYIPLNIHTWKSKEKAWTWVCPANGLEIGEYTICGSLDKTIILPIHLDHPQMANDNLSGVVVAMKLIDLLIDRKLKYTYKFLFVPETIGVMAWLSRYGTNYKYGISIDSVGTDGDIVTSKTKTHSRLNTYIEGKTNEFMSYEHLMTGNDERALESVGIPSILVSRLPFKEYHTKDDTPDIISEDRLNEVVSFTESLILRIERDFIPIPIYEGLTCLSANDLWGDEYQISENFINVEKIWHLIGTNSISEIASIAGLTFDYVYDFISKLESKGLIGGNR